jgi:murein L,D-transpeptidase YcbB/YkuD
MKELFGRDNRRQSHGCVRVQNPRELAALLLQQPIDWVNRAIQLGYTHRQALPAPLPVFVVYRTVTIAAGGSVAFYPDVYQRDAEISYRLYELQAGISLSEKAKPEMASNGIATEPQQSSKCFAL